MPKLATHSTPRAVWEHRDEWAKYESNKPYVDFLEALATEDIARLVLWQLNGQPIHPNASNNAWFEHYMRYIGEILDAREEKENT